MSDLDNFYDLFIGSFPVNRGEILKGIFVDTYTNESIDKLPKASHNDEAGLYPIVGTFSGGVNVVHVGNFPKGIYFLHYMDGSITLHLSISMKLLDYKMFFETQARMSLIPENLRVQNDVMLLRQHPWVKFGHDSDYCVSLTLTGLYSYAKLKELEIPIIETVDQFKKQILDEDYYGKSELAHMVAEKWYKEHLEKGNNLG